MVLHERLSNLINKMVRERAILTELGNLHISFK